MENNFGNDFITISDDDGNDYVLEHLDTVEIDGTFYMAFLPTDIDEDDDKYGLVILKTDNHGEEEILVTVDDDGMLETLYNIFLERLLENDE